MYESQVSESQVNNRSGLCDREGKAIQNWGEKIKNLSFPFLTQDSDKAPDGGSVLSMNLQQ